MNTHTHYTSLDIILFIKALPLSPDMKDIISKQEFKDLHASMEDMRLQFSMEITPKEHLPAENLKKILEKKLQERFNFKYILIILTAHKMAPEFKTNKTPSVSNAQQDAKNKMFELPHLKHIIAVSSGKGGVGKSTIAVNLAASYAALGYKTGLLDADIYGPSVPRLTKTHKIDKPKFNDHTKKLVPHHITIGDKKLYLMSIGYLIEETTPMIWRGPMVQSAIRQLFLDVDWPELDILVLDLPPGTGDVQLTMAQKIPLTGAIIVSTPQDIALLDAQKGVEMFKKLNVPLLGLIENMSYFNCPNCGHESHIFSHKGAQEMSEQQNIPFLGHIPLTLSIRHYADQGLPLIHPDADHCTQYDTQKERDLFLTLAKKSLLSSRL